jgi:hypothetical protein
MDSGENQNNKIILAKFNEKTIRVYQAYTDAIANEALKLGTFGKRFSLDRMTWVKPSFLWMMYRSGWASKEGQNRVLAIDIERTGFDIMLENVILSTFKKEFYDSIEDWKEKVKRSNVRCQWDPDRDIYGNRINRRAIQLGLRGIIVNRYVNEWIVNINDITKYVFDLKEKINQKTFSDDMLPIELEYPVDDSVKEILGIK